MEVQIVKVLVLLALFVMTFLLGILPVIMIKIFKKSEDLHRKRKYKLTLSFLSCYAAGVFLGTGVLDLLPDVRIDIATALNSMNIIASFPVAEFVMMFGLFLILIIEQIVLTVKENHLQKQVNAQNVESHSGEPNARTPLLSGRQNKTVKKYDGNHADGNHGKRFRGAHSLLTESDTHDRTHSIRSDNSIHGISDEPFHNSFEGSLTRQHCDNCEERISIEQSGTYDEVDEEAEADLHPAHEHSSLRSLLLLLALSLHSVFEGLAVGLQQKSEDVLGIFAALLVHKSILSFSLGMNLIQSKLSHAGIVKSIVFFSLTSPVGVAIGIGIIDLWDSQSSTLVQGILSGIACGTFLYVTFFEVLPCEFNSFDHRLLKVLFLLLGFSTITGVIFLQHDDSPTCYILPPAGSDGP